MTMVEIGNCRDPLVDGIIGGYEFEDILDILDFPMESIEETETGFGANWDPQFLGPIPSSVLTEPPKVKIDTGPPYMLSGPVTSLLIAPEQKLPGNIGASKPYVLKPNKLAKIQESKTFGTQSPQSILETSASSSSTAKIPPTHFNTPIPVRARSKRIRRAASNPWLRQYATSSFTSKLYSNREYPSSQCPPFIKKCAHCEVTKTPQWREGPLGPKTLCNACGVRYRSGRLFPEYRPAASPTFVPCLHSNSHQKVIQMRNKGKRPMTTYVEEPPPMSPEAEFIPMSSHFFDLY